MKLILRSMSRAVGMVAVPLLFAAGCAHSPPPAAVDDTTTETGKPTLPKISAQYRFILLSGEQKCPDTNGECNVKVQMSKLTDGTGTYCLAELPAKIEFSQTESGNSPKDIVWKLVPKDPSFDLTVEFQEQVGILLIKNDKSQIVHGGWGNGSERIEYHMKNEHKKKGTSTYLPIIMQIGALGTEPKMCAAADPKIVNN